MGILCDSDYSCVSGRLALKKKHILLLPIYQSAIARCHLEIELIIWDSYTGDVRVCYWVGLRFLSLGPINHTIFLASFLLLVVTCWAWSESTESGRQTAWLPKFSPCSPELSLCLCLSLCPHNLQFISGTALGLHICYPWVYKFGGLWSMLKLSLSTGYIEICGTQLVSIHREEKLLQWKHSEGTHPQPIYTTNLYTKSCNDCS
jgi:hypothetical protein